MHFVLKAIVGAYFGFICLDGCSSRAPDIDPRKEPLIDKLTLFVEAVQADKYDQAFGYLTEDERSKMLASGNEPSPEVQRQLKALRLSTLAQKPGVRLVRGKLDGIYEQLPMLNPAPAGRKPAPADIPLIQ